MSNTHLVAGLPFVFKYCTFVFVYTSVSCPSAGTEVSHSLHSIYYHKSLLITWQISFVSARHRPHRRYSTSTPIVFYSIIRGSCRSTRMRRERSRRRISLVSWYVPCALLRHHRGWLISRLFGAYSMCHLRTDQSDVRGSKTQCDRDGGAITCIPLSVMKQTIVMPLHQRNEYATRRD